MNTSFLVTLRSRPSEGPSRVITQRVWNHGDTLPLGYPFRWVLEKTTHGVRVRSLTAPLKKIAADSVFEVESLDQHHTTQIGLGKTGFEILLRPIHRPQFSSNKKPIAAEDVLQAFCSIRNWVIATERFSTEFTAQYRGEKIFKLTRSGTQFSLVSLHEGVQLSGLPMMNKGETQTLNGELLGQSKVQWNQVHWTFAGAPVFSAQDLSSLPVHTDPEAQVFKKALRQSGIALGAFLIACLVLPFLQSKPEVIEVVPPQTVKLAQSVGQTASEKASSSSASNASSAAASKKAQTAARDAFRAKALQSAVSGLLKGGMTSLMAYSSSQLGKNSTDQAQRMLSGSSAGGETVGGKNSNTAVGGVGGGATTGSVGYGAGQRAGTGKGGPAYVSLDLGNADVEEGLTKDEVGRVIHAHLSEIRYCHESAMLRVPDIEGKLMLNFVIGADGRVQTADVKESSIPDSLNDCVIRRLLSWGFPRPKGGKQVAVTYPFIFKSLGR